MTTPRKWEAGTHVEAYHPAHPNPPGSGPNFRPAVVVDQGGSGYYVKCLWDDDGLEGTTFHLNVRLPGEPDPLTAAYGKRTETATEAP